MTEAVAGDLVLIERAADLAALAAAAARAPALAVDVEANGLHAYRPRLCTVQLAFAAGAGGAIQVAVIDALRLDLTPLAPLLGPAGPTKILHDLTFDARLLHAAGAPLGGRVRDTSVAARFLGCAATGLAALLAVELDLALDKELQQHDWARRPLSAAELRYLAGDVRHLPHLEARLAERARALGIEPEIADECAYKLDAALGPPRDDRPAYARAKGAAALDPAGRAILRRLFDARAAAAEALDVPAFKVVPNEVLLALARDKPRTLDAVRAIPGAAAGRAAGWIGAWQRAVEEGLRDGDVPDVEREALEPPRPDKQAIARRRAKEAEIGAWRRAEARARGVDAQVVLPGHCAQDLIAIALGAEAGGAEAVRAAIARIPGLGASRLARYGEALARLAGAGE